MALDSPALWTEVTAQLLIVFYPPFVADNNEPYSVKRKRSQVFFGAVNSVIRPIRITSELLLPLKI